MTEAEDETSPDPTSGPLVDAVAPRAGMSPYPTGGGGVTFERRVAVQYLAHLLADDGAVGASPTSRCWSYE